MGLWLGGGLPSVLAQLPWAVPVAGAFLVGCGMQAPAPWYFGLALLSGLGAAPLRSIGPGVLGLLLHSSLFALGLAVC